MGDQMSKEQQEYIEKIQKDCLERTNMTEEEAWNFAFRCWQLGYMKPTKVLVEQIFNYGSTYSFASLNSGKFHGGQFPTDNFENAIDYVYRLLIENERDNECLECKRYHSGSCIGTINRGRKTITDGNRCGGFIKES